MSDFSWNKQQLEAIESGGNTILVSAAAGSGKTAVLVERIIRKLTDETNPANIEDFLIVTFTKAAASQMKEKISAALSKKIAENPNNMHLRECRFKLPFANISTIDAFAISLARDNFNTLGIAPDFSILENARQTLLEKNTLAQVIEEFHNEYPAEFENLNNLLNDNKSDKNIEETILLLYKKSTAQIFPEKWLDSLVKPYETGPVCDSPETVTFLNRTEKRINEFLNGIDYCFELIKADEANSRKFAAKLADDRSSLERILNSLHTNDWDKICRVINSTEIADNRGGPQKPDPAVKNIVAGIRTHLRNYVDNIKDYFKDSQDEINLFKDKVRPAANLLIKAVNRYREILDESKRRENAYGFGDILRFAVKLLVSEEDGKPVRSELAKELSLNFREIFVDEYQDVNAAQDMVFEALSQNDSNRFLVGDIKQSIYGFRNAMPEVFLSLRDNIEEHPDLKRIYLNSNYRSRSEVTDTANYIFSKIMSKSVGNVDYDDREFLNPEASYDKTPDIKIEFSIINCSDNSAENLRCQAVYAAGKIRDAVESKMQIVTGKDENGKDITRDAVYSDFAILYRSKKCGKVFSEVFEKLEIPFKSDNDDTFINSTEINFLKCLLRVIDNPTDDIALATVMLSPVYGFTPDDLALMRAELKSRRARFFKCVLNAASKGNEKAGQFVASIERLRRTASVMPAGEFTADLIDETGLRAIVSKMRNSKARLANINSFINLANSFENAGIKGLSAFVRFVMKLNDGDVTVSSKSAAGNSECVNMMTIHKSKGLEFPVVILADTDRQFNKSDYQNDVIISDKCGLGLKYIEDNVKYKSHIWKFANADKKLENTSEEIRILYVALTRAKERLIMLATESKGLSLKKLSGVMPGNKTINDGTVAEMNSYAKMIGGALLSHPDANILRRLSETGSDYIDNCETRIDFNVITEIEEEQEKEAGEEKVYSANPVLLEDIRRRLEYRYPYESLNRIRAKATASKLGTRKFVRRYFASSTPSFARGDKLTGAQKGTATHRFMQFCDFLSAAANPQAEAERLFSQGILSREQADCLDFESVSEFFNSSVAKRIIASGKVYREYQFTASLPVTDLYPEADDRAENEVIIIDGVVDCAFEENGRLIILDFKTDYAENENELIEEYSPQLNTYRKCMSKVLGIDVAETLIYSFRLNKEIPVL